MNSYGHRALSHWQQWRPNQLAEITDPETFFTRLGEQVAADISQLATDLAGQDIPGEGYLGKLGRLRMARFTAESQILRESVLLPPEEDEEEENPPPPDDGWIPIVMDPAHPYWAKYLQEEAELNG